MLIFFILFYFYDVELQCDNKSRSSREYSLPKESEGGLFSWKKFLLF